jgi:hypothetical protein
VNGVKRLGGERGRKTQEDVWGSRKRRETPSASAEGGRKNVEARGCERSPEGRKTPFAGAEGRRKNVEARGCERSKKWRETPLAGAEGGRKNVRRGVRKEQRMGGKHLGRVRNEGEKSCVSVFESSRKGRERPRTGVEGGRKSVT